MTPIESNALAEAISSHAGQYRDDGQPYVTHPIRVRKRLEEIGAPEDILAAALLHDISEDTGVPILHFYHKYGLAIGTAVNAMTKRPNMSHEEYYAQFSRFCAINPWILALKLADCYDNLSNMEALTQKRQERYMAVTEKYLLPLAEKYRTLYTDRLKEDILYIMPAIRKYIINNPQ